MFFKALNRRKRCEMPMDKAESCDNVGEDLPADVVVEFGSEKMCIKIKHGRVVEYKWPIALGYGELDRKLADMHGLKVSEARQLRLKHAGPSGDEQIIGHVRGILRDEIMGLCQEVEACLRCYNASHRGGTRCGIEVVGKKKEAEWFSAFVVKELENREKRRQAAA